VKTFKVHFKSINMWNVPKSNIQPLNNYLEPHGEHGNLQLKDIKNVQERKQAKEKKHIWYHNL